MLFRLYTLTLYRFRNFGPYNHARGRCIWHYVRYIISLICPSSVLCTCEALCLTFFSILLSIHLHVWYHFCSKLKWYISLFCRNSRVLFFVSQEKLPSLHHRLLAPALFTPISCTEFTNEYLFCGNACSINLLKDCSHHHYCYFNCYCILVVYCCLSRVNDLYIRILVRMIRVAIAKYHSDFIEFLMELIFCWLVVVLHCYFSLSLYLFFFKNCSVCKWNLHLSIINYSCFAFLFTIIITSATVFLQFSLVQEYF